MITVVLFARLLLVLLHPLCSINFCFAQQKSTVAPFDPFRLPMAVRNPYLNTWLAQGNNSPQLGDKWVSFWNDDVSILFSRLCKG